MATEDIAVPLLVPTGGSSHKQDDDANKDEKAGGDVEEGVTTDRQLTSASKWSKVRAVVKTRAILKLLPGMKIKAHRIEADGSLVPCDANDALEASATSSSNIGDEPGSYWIDIDSDDRDANELRGFLDQLELSPFLASTLSKSTSTWASQVLPLQASCLVLLRILPEDNVDDQCAEGDHLSHESAHIAALSVRNLLLTLTSCKRQLIGGLDDEALDFMKVREKVPGASSSGALLLWLVFHVERTAHAVRLLRSRVLHMTELMDNNASAVSLPEIQSTKKQLHEFLAVAEEQLESLQGLANVESDTKVVDFQNIRGTLGIVLATAGSTERMALRLEKRVADLRQSYESIQQGRLSHRLALLTVLSATFLPLSFLVGLYGMNFVNIPELHHQNGYHVLLGAMGFIVSSLLTYFYCNGWFV
jgi:hypothetical protein